MLFRSIIKTIICLGISETASILFFLSIHFNSGAVPPIHTTNENVADPFVQALMLTAIVIGISVTALAVSLFLGLHERYGTTHWDKASKARKEEALL